VLNPRQSSLRQSANKNNNLLRLILSPLIRKQNTFQSQSRTPNLTPILYLPGSSTDKTIAKLYTVDELARRARANGA
jgi:hypothetical protein